MPATWMQSWRAHHPDWDYTLYDNRFLENFRFRTRKQINEYMKRGQYAGVADLMRLEILFEYGGLIPGADSICLASMEHLFTRKCAYTIFENELVRGELVSPIQACEPGNPFVGTLIEVLRATDPATLEEPWVSTGNLFVTRKIAELSPDLVIFPSHYMIPIHYTGVCYEGDGPVYAVQKFGSTPTGYSREGYEKPSFIARLVNLGKKRAMINYNRNRLAAARTIRISNAMKKMGI